MNIIAIVIDTLRYDHLGAHGNDWIRTPNLDRLAARSWVFDNSYTCSYPTIPHRTDALTGGCGHPFHAWGPLRFDVPTLPRALAQQGYATQLIHDTPHLVNGGHNFDWPFHAWTFVRGAEVDRPRIDDAADWPDNWKLDPLFDALGVDIEKDGLSRMLHTYTRANRNRKSEDDWNCAKLFGAASRFLAANARRDNFFLWVDCFDPHEPWDAPPEFVRLYDDTPGYDGTIDPRGLMLPGGAELSEPMKRRLSAMYAAKVSWADRQLGKLLDTLEATGLGERTALLLTSDHGTNVGEDGKFGKGYPVREQEARTPFMICAPGAGSGRSDVIVQPQDIFATVMGLAGLPTPAGLDSNDVLAVARDGKPAPRKLALAGKPFDNDRPDAIQCTVFDTEWALFLTADPATCRLRRMGSLEELAEDNKDVVERLRVAGIEELVRRETDPALVAWLRGEGGGAYPRGCRLSDNLPSPAGYKTYFGRLYDGC